MRMAMVTAGTRRRWGSSRRMERLDIPKFSRIMRPRLGFGGWMPIPNQLSTTSDPATAPIPIETDTMTGLMAFGSRCRKTMRRFEAPMALAASTYWLSFSDSTWPLTSRAMPTQLNRVSDANTTK